MDSLISFSNAALPSWFGLLAATALAFAVVTNLVLTLPRRRSVAVKLLVVVLNVACALCLWAFLSPPSLPGGGTSAVVLTPGATDADLEEAMRAPAAFALPGVPLADSEVRQVTPVSDLAAIRRARPGVARLRILGSGLPAAQWRDVEDWSLSFSPPPAPDGIFRPWWPRRLAAGEPLPVTGTVHLNDGGQAVVHLVDPSGNIVVSQTVSDGGRFALQAPVRASGRLLFGLRLEREDGTPIATEPVPVSVFEPPALRVLMLLAAPSFESRAAVRWARQAGTALALRTAISQDRNRTTFFGMQETVLEPLTDSVVQSLDLVVVDGRQWSALSAADRATLSRAVAAGGPGLLLMLRPDDPSPTGALPWPPLSPASAQSPTVKLTSGSLADAVLSHSAGTLDAAPDQVLWRDLASLPVAAWQRHGRGRLGVTMVTDSYSLVTAGFAADHARYWQTLLDGVRTPRASLGFSSSPTLPQADWRLELCAWGEAATGTATLNGNPLPLANQPLAPGQQCGYSWPAEAGWQRFALGDHTRDLYVFPPQAWRTDRHFEASAATALASQRPSSVTRNRENTRKQLPALWFFLAFTALAGLLWLEQKIADPAPAAS